MPDLNHDPDDAELRRWLADGRAPAGSCPFCASRISMIQREDYFIARCSHRGCGAVGPKMRRITRAADLFCCPPPRQAQGMAVHPSSLTDVVTMLEQERDTAFDRGRAVGREDVGKYSHAIGQIEGVLGIVGAKPLRETVESVRALAARVAALEAELARQAPVVTVAMLDGVDRFDEWRDAVRVDVDGVMVGAEEFGSAPEDNSGSRAYRWVPEMLDALAAKLGATVERKDEHNLDAGAFDDKLYPPDKRLVAERDRWQTFAHAAKDALHESERLRAADLAAFEESLEEPAAEMAGMLDKTVVAKLAALSDDRDTALARVAELEAENARLRAQLATRATLDTIATLNTLTALETT